MPTTTAFCKDFIKALSISGKTITYTKSTGTTGTITTQDTVYTHPTTAGNKHIPSGGSSGQILRWSADGTAVWGADNNTTYSTFVKSGSTAAAGLVPKPSTTAGTTKYLREDCTWSVPPDNNTTYSATTTSANGLMTAAMVTKLNGIATSAGKYTLQTTVTSASTSGVSKTISGLQVGQFVILVGSSVVSDLYVQSMTGCFNAGDNSNFGHMILLTTATSITIVFRGVGSFDIYY